VIAAPSDGMVVRKGVNVGAALTPGQTIITMTFGHDVWVTANFKETQLRGVKPGDPAEVEVDAIPGEVFKGVVVSVNEATGASTALLPPDNATGNFTKVVQRIPVKIALVAAGASERGKYATEQDIANLRQGMSVTATVDVSKR
jgi:membrane fusion protein (multidrug efflux system)